MVLDNPAQKAIIKKSTFDMWRGMVLGMNFRSTISLNKNWQFIRSRASRGWLDFAANSSEENVSLPHCWNTDDAFIDGVEYYRGWGSYRSRFDLSDMIHDAADSTGFRWGLVSEGFYGTGDVWLNGKKLGSVDGQYLGFSFDVTNLIKTDTENQISIRLTNRCRLSVLPGKEMPDFLLYGGMSGGLRIERIPAVSIDDNATQVESIVDDAGNSAKVVISSELVAGVSESAGRAGCPTYGSEALAADYDLSWRILDTDELVVAEGASVRPGLRAGHCSGDDSAHRPESTGCESISITIENPQLWDIDSPQFYTAEGSLSFAGKIIDQVKIRFGIRTAEFRPNEGFFLNGRRVALRGCNRHESMPGFGRALPLAQHREDAKLIKSMGLNFVRLSHYPQHPAFLNACDDLGILVYAEIASWKSVRGGAWLKNACRQMHDMITRDRNHPSVIMWGMGNEGRHLGAYRKLYALCKSLDPQRAVTYAENHLYRARRKKTIGIPDVWGLNYEFDALEEGRDASRLKCVVVSESSNCPHTKPGDKAAEKIQLDTIKKDLATMEKHKYVAGYALWCFNDYATLRKQRYKRYSGLVDALRKPKSSAYWLANEFGGNLK